MPLKIIQQNGHATIYESDIFAEGVSVLESQRKSKSCLALLDLDLTVFNYRHTLGTDFWFDFDYNAFLQSGLPPTEAKQKTLNYYLGIVGDIHHEDIYVVEEYTPEQIRRMQSSGIETWALTSRGYYLRETTIKQLSRFDINFNNCTHSDQEFRIDSFDESFFTNGMILSGGENKGYCLISCLKRLQYFPDFIFMWDDKISNLEKVAKAINEFNQEMLKNNPLHKPIEFNGLRYSRTDQLLAKVKPEVIELQRKYKMRILSDEHAHAILKSEEKKVRKHFVKIELKPNENKVYLSIYKPYIYKIILDLDPDIAKHKSVSSIRQINGKEKLTHDYEYTISKFEPLFHKLSRHGLIEYSDHDQLNKIYSRSSSPITHRYQLRNRETKNSKPTETIQAKTKTYKI